MREITGQKASSVTGRYKFPSKVLIAFIVVSIMKYKT